MVEVYKSASNGVISTGRSAAGEHKLANLFKFLVHLGKHCLASLIYADRSQVIFDVLTHFAQAWGKNTGATAFEAVSCIQHCFDITAL